MIQYLGLLCAQKRSQQPPEIERLSSQQPSPTTSAATSSTMVTQSTSPSQAGQQQRIGIECMHIVQSIHSLM